MAAVVVILAAEQRGRLVEERRLHGSKPLGHAVDLLVDVGLAQVADGARGKFLFALLATA